jgi:hypothetical protein
LNVVLDTKEEKNLAETRNVKLAEYGTKRESGREDTAGYWAAQSEGRCNELLDNE